MKLYKQQAIETEDTEFRQEARYKHGSCLVELNRIDEATQVFEPLLGEGSGERWPPLAGCQLWLLRLKQKRIEEADAVYQTLATRFSFEQLAVLIPSDLRDEILRLYQDEFRYIGNVLRFSELEETGGVFRIRGAVPLQPWLIRWAGAAAG